MPITIPTFSSELALPYEIRQLIFEYVDGTDDLDAVKSLRLVSKPWALVGFGFLLRDTFVIKRNSDIDRLSSVTSDEKRLARSTTHIHTLQIQYRPSSLSVIRDELPEFHVPQDAGLPADTEDCTAVEVAREFEEVDSKWSNTDLNDLNRLEVLTAAFCKLPRIKKIDFAVPNPFKHRELKRLWDITSLCNHQIHFGSEWTIHLMNLLRAATEAKLDLEEFSYTQLPSTLLEPANIQLRVEMLHHLSKVKTLSLVINYDHSNSDPSSVLDGNGAAIMLEQIIQSLPHLESLSLSFTLTQLVPILYWPTVISRNLHSLRVFEISISYVDFIAFLTNHKRSLRRLSVGSVLIRDRDISCKDFFEGLRLSFQDFEIEKFELRGSVYSSVLRDAAFCTPGIYTDTWEDIVPEDGPIPTWTKKSRGLEEFVLRSGQWPFGDEDDITHFDRF